jgi:hypothetical protein
MSIIKAILHQIGLSGDPAKNFTLNVPAAPDGTMKLSRGNAGAPTQDIITVDALGKLAFPAQGQTLAVQGRIVLPGGLILQWGQSSNSNDLGPGWSQILFPVPFPTACLSVISTPQTSVALAYELRPANPVFGSLNVNGFQWVAYTPSGAPESNQNYTVIQWLAIGH